MKNMVESGQKAKAANLFSWSDCTCLQCTALKLRSLKIEGNVKFSSLTFEEKRLSRFIELRVRIELSGAAQLKI